MTASLPIPFDTPGASPHRALCTDCGISRSTAPERCGRACQFIRPDYPALEARVHRRARDPGRPDELHFGPFQRMVRAELRRPLAGAQWTGITTRLGERLLETGRVDAVLTMTAHAEDRWRPRPVLVTRAADMAARRGMRMGYAPLLALLDADPASITYLEFRTDFRIELRYADGRSRTVPFLSLLIAELPADFFPLTCRTCVDYSNVLADLTVGYMGGDGQHWLLVRNARGDPPP